MTQTPHVCRTALSGLIVVLSASLGLQVVQAGSHPNFGCYACHVPHNANADQSVPLWNPARTTTTLTDNYTSPTLDATISSVDGASKLCVSCHDGSHVFPSITLHALSTTHPVSFVYDQQLAIDDGELVDPTTLEGGILDINGKMQCTSCHDVHVTAAADPNLRWPYENTIDDSGITDLNNVAFCRHCHLK